LVVVAGCWMVWSVLVGLGLGWVFVLWGLVLLFS
jgi:hypothetical protein